MTFQSIDDVHGCDSLALGMLCVGDGITDDVLKEHLQDTTGLFVDQTRYTLDTTTTGQSTDCRLGYSLDVITQNFAMTLRSSFTESLSSLASSRHIYACVYSMKNMNKLISFDNWTFLFILPGTVRPTPQTHLESIGPSGPNDSADRPIGRRSKNTALLWLLLARSMFVCVCVCVWSAGCRATIDNRVVFVDYGAGI